MVEAAAKTPAAPKTEAPKSDAKPEGEKKPRRNLGPALRGEDVIRVIGKNPSREGCKAFKYNEQLKDGMTVADAEKIVVDGETWKGGAKGHLRWLADPEARKDGSVMIKFDYAPRPEPKPKEPKAKKDDKAAKADKTKAA